MCRPACRRNHIGTSDLLFLRVLLIKFSCTKKYFIKKLYDVVVFYKVVNKILKGYYSQFIKKLVIVLYVDIKLLTGFSF